MVCLREETICRNAVFRMKSCLMIYGQSLEMMSIVIQAQRKFGSKARERAVPFLAHPSL